MTVTNNTNRADYQGNGAVSTFSFSFRYFDPTDISVILTNTATGVETTLVNGTDYTLSPSASGIGGSVTLMGGSPATGTNVTILRTVPLTQLTDISNQGPFYPKIHEDAFDKLTMIDQQLSEQLSRALVLPVGINSGFNFTFPANLSQNPGAAIVIDPTGTTFALGPTATQITTAQAIANAAIASAQAQATAAAASATAAANTLTQVQATATNVHAFLINSSGNVLCSSNSAEPYSLKATLTTLNN